MSRCAHTRETSRISHPQNRFHVPSSWRVHFILILEQKKKILLFTRSLASVRFQYVVHVSGSNFINDIVNGLKIFRQAFDCCQKDFSGYLDFVWSIPSHLVFAEGRKRRGRGKQRFWNSIFSRIGWTFEGMKLWWQLIKVKLNTSCVWDEKGWRRRRVILTKSFRNKI